MARRRHLAFVVGGFALLFLVIGAVTLTGASSAVLVAIAVVALVAGVLLALVTWGVAASISRDTADRDIDAIVAAAIAANAKRPGAVACGCGHEHDPDEMHVVPAPTDSCAHDGNGVDCTHTCETCVLSDLRR